MYGYNTEITITLFLAPYRSAYFVMGIAANPEIRSQQRALCCSPCAALGINAPYPQVPTGSGSWDAADILISCARGKQFGLLRPSNPSKPHSRGISNSIGHICLECRAVFWCGGSGIGATWVLWLHLTLQG